MIIEIFNQFIKKLINCNSWNYPWSREVGEDTFDFLSFQINKQFWIIKDYLLAICNILHIKVISILLSYLDMMFSIYEDLE